MSEQSEQRPPATASVPDGVADAARTRRGVLKGLGLGSPILLTLANAPVQAAAVCVMPSGHLSAATFNSRHQGATVCTSQGPNYFNANHGVWPASAPAPLTTLFSAIFLANPDFGLPTDLVPQVLAGGASTFTKYCIAAYLNARTPPVGWPGLTPAQVLELWRYFKATGPLPGWIPASWTILEAQAWLSTLMSP